MNMAQERHKSIWSLVLGVAVLLVGCGGGARGDRVSPQQAASVEKAEVWTEISRNQNIWAQDKGSETGKSKAADKRPGRLIARLKSPDGLTKQSIDTAGQELNALGFSVVRRSQFAATGNQKAASAGQATAKAPLVFWVLEYDASQMTTAQAIDKAMASGFLQYAEPDAPKKKQLVPNDPNFGSQWHHAKIQSDVAWNTHTGTGSVVVAVIDDGIHATHPDLTANIWTNSTEIPGNGIDDDGDGYIDNINGANAAGGNGNTIPNPGSSHGTSVASFVSAVGNNGVGGAGVDWNARLMAVKVEDSSNQILTSYIVDALLFVVQKRLAGVNVRVVNMSLTGPLSAAERDAVDLAGFYGILVVAAAGNEGTNFKEASYPAALGLPNVISVGASDASDNKATFSNYGAWVDVMAPGAAVFGATGAASYGLLDGTSFSSPIVAGAAALLWDKFPNLTVAEVKRRIVGGADATVALAGLSASGARLNVAGALTGICHVLAPSVANSGGNALVVGANYVIQTGYVAACPGETTGIDIASSGSPWLTLKDDGIFPDLRAGDGYYAASIVPNAPGSLALSARHLHVSGAPVSNAARPVTIASGVNYNATAQPINWLDGVTGGTRLVMGAAANGELADDDGNALVNLPFPVTFYGVPVSSVRVAVNGMICSAVATDCGVFFRIPIPMGRNSLINYGFIAPMSEDWWGVPNGTFPNAGVYTRTTGTAPNRKFIVTWHDMRAFADNASTVPIGVRFQVVFTEGSTGFDMNYNSTFTPTPVHSNGGTASIGVQYVNGHIGGRLSFQGDQRVGSLTSYRWTPVANSFPDVLGTDFFALSAESLRGSFITVGCAAGNYCPNDNTTREQMAAFLARAVAGHDLLVDYSGVPSGNFSDVSPQSPFAKYINFIKLAGITQGCGGSNYCPTDNVTRGQMAVFLVRAVRGGGFVPPAATGVFSDVPPTSVFAPFVEELGRMGVTAGCGGSNYCPDQLVTRGQMAAFLQRAFRPYDYAVR